VAFVFFLGQSLPILHPADLVRAFGTGPIMAQDDHKIDGRLHGEQFEPESAESLLMRLVYMVIIWLMIQFAQTVLGVVTVLQFLVMALNNKQPNERIADFGTDLGIWVAKAARYQTAASNVKPWPWTDLD
jgi:hypothetical protein